jgi:hypothetical protein
MGSSTTSCLVDARHECVESFTSGCINGSLRALQQQQETQNQLSHRSSWHQRTYICIHQSGQTKARDVWLHISSGYLVYLE